MELIADGVLILAALAAMAYCMVLSRRLRRLTELDGRLGAAITALSREVDHLSGALTEVKTATTDSATDLGVQCRAAHIAARRLETLVKSANKTVFSKAPSLEPTAANNSVLERPAGKLTAKIGRHMEPSVVSKQAEKTAESVPPVSTTAPDADVVSATDDEVVPPRPAKKRKTPADMPTPALKDVKSIDGLDATALDQFIGAIIAKGNADDNAALARRLVMALAGPEGAHISRSLRRPAMLILAACFMVSALSRLFDPSGALAYEVQKRGAETAPEQAPPNADMASLLATLRVREAQLDDRMRKIAEKERVIEAAEVRLRDQMAELEGVETRLANLIRVADKASENDVGKLIAAYQTMGGKKAGPIFETIDSTFAAGLISRMDNAPAAEILSAITPEKAYEITILVASQNARGPLE
jgi:flagellar motility protein MotE (MotC chaperone)